MNEQFLQLHNILGRNMYACLYIYLHYVCITVCMCMYAYMCACVCVHVCICVCMYLYNFFILLYCMVCFSYTKKMYAGAYPEMDRGGGGGGVPNGQRAKFFATTPTQQYS